MWIGLVLAGGASRRMGSDKALLGIGGVTRLQRAVGAVRDAGGDPLVMGPPRSAEEWLDGSRNNFLLAIAPGDSVC